jgi:hypothetical protein
MERQKSLPLPLPPLVLPEKNKHRLPSLDAPQARKLHKSSAKPTVWETPVPRAYRRPKKGQGYLRMLRSVTEEKSR